MAGKHIDVVAVMRDAAHAIDPVYSAFNVPVDREMGARLDQARALVSELLAENERIARHMEEAVRFIETKYPDAKHLDRGPILRNLRRWSERLRTAARATQPLPTMSEETK